jgi:hypothetical protein
MSSRKDRINSVFMMVRKNILSGSDARAHDAITRLVNAEIKREKDAKANRTES